MSDHSIHSIHQHVARAVQQLTGTPYAAALQTVRDTQDASVAKRIARAATELHLSAQAEPADDTARPRTLPCSTCSNPVEDLQRETVWLDEADSRRIRQYLEEERKRREAKLLAGDTSLEAYSFSELMAVPTAEWQLRHDACIGEDDAAHYFFEGSMLATPARALEQLCHLAGKNWTLKETDLLSFFRRVYPPR